MLSTLSRSDLVAMARFKINKVEEILSVGEHPMATLTGLTSLNLSIL